MERGLLPSTAANAQSSPCQYHHGPSEIFNEYEEYSGPYYADMDDEEDFDEEATGYPLFRERNDMEPFYAEHFSSTDNRFRPEEHPSYSDGYQLEPKAYDPNGGYPSEHEDEELELDESYRFAFKDFEFDEEDCRNYLIFDGGAELARIFRYCDAIDELHHRLMCRYGDRNISKAIAVLRSLLEDDDACGLGDDGDVFRCWRHEWKHRDEDLSNPPTPKFPGMILPPAPPRQRKKPSSSQNSPGSPTFNDGYNTLRPLRFTAVRGPRAPEDYPIVTPPEEVWFSRASLNPDSRITPVEKSMKEKGIGLARQRFRSHSETMRKMVPRNLSNPFKKGKEEKRNTHNTHGTKNSPPEGSFDGKKCPNCSARLPSCQTGFDGAADDYDNDHQSQSIQQCHNGPLSYCHMGGSSIDKSSDGSSSGIGSVIDLNRALPPVPTNALQKAELVDRTSSSGNHSASSTAVSFGYHSHSSSKHEFQNITRELLAPAYPELSATSQNIGSLDPNKFSPPPSRDKHSNMNDHYASYRLTNNNPFLGEQRQTQWPTVIDERSRWQPYEFSPAFEAQYTTKPKGMSHSRSEGSVAIMAGPTPIDTTRANKAYVHPAAFERAHHGNISPVRGRSNSPVKFADDVREQVTVEALPTDRKRSRSPVKKVFGENGWLGRSISMKDMSNESPKKTGLKHWGGKLIQRVEGITEDVSKKLPHPLKAEGSSKQSHQSKFPVSLNPLAQAKLYSEVELMICATANSFLMNQKRHGLMSLESITKVIETWKSKGRPQVIQFQFDQATQRDLILYNLKAFQFCGPQADDAIAINSMMYNWKSVAKEMSVRTFCTPDSVIRKHLHDIYKILEMLGAPEVTFLAFQDISVNAAKTMRDAQRKRDEKQFIQYGVERPWYPPTKEGTEANGALDDLIEE